MNTLRNTVKLIGNLGIDPKVKQLKNNTLARFSLATNETYKNADGEWVQNTTWHNIVAWGKTAELCERLLKKGAEIALNGKLVNNSYETKDGEKRYATDVHIREFLLLNRKEQNKSSNE